VVLVGRGMLVCAELAADGYARGKGKAGDVSL
jgi:hypothetical protein